MRRVISVATIVACIVGLTVLCQNYPGTVSAQEGAKKAAAEKKADTAKKARGRLPSLYGQIGLSEEQRTKVYAVQAKYSAQIEELEKQIAALREKEQQEIGAVLSAEQKQKLTQLQEEAAKERQSRSKKKTEQ